MLKLIFVTILFFGLMSVAQNVDLLINPEDYRWLYKQIFSESDRKNYSAESFKSFRVHLLDTDSKFPSLADISLRNLKNIGRIEGQMTYISIVQKWYRYDVTMSADSELIHSVKIHLKNATPSDIASFTTKLKMAEDLWNQNRLKVDLKYKFEFEIVLDPTKSHFSVAVVDKTNGPYDTVWSRDWPSNVVAHEVGHMLGLGDEYNAFANQFDCLTKSLMCAAWTARPIGHEYYFILRRLIK